MNGRSTVIIPCREFRGGGNGTGQGREGSPGAGQVNKPDSFGSSLIRLPRYGQRQDFTDSPVNKGGTT